MAEPNNDPNLPPIDPESRIPVPTRRAEMREPWDPVPPVAVARTDEERLNRAREHACLAARIASDNRAKDILLLDMREVTPLVDFLVVASVNSRRQAQSTASEIDAEMKKIGDYKLGMEGYEDGRWVLVDYGDFVVHVLSSEARSYYGLEELWGDAVLLDWQTGEPIVDPDKADDDEDDDDVDDDDANLDGADDIDIDLDIDDEDGDAK